MSPLSAVLVLTAIVNGIFSPFVFWVAALWIFWYPSGLVAPSPSGILFGASLITATLTLLVGGVPAALCERLAAPSTPVAQAVWLAGVLVLALPGLLRAATFL